MKNWVAVVLITTFIGSDAYAQTGAFDDDNAAVEAAIESTLPATETTSTLNRLQSEIKGVLTNYEYKEPGLMELNGFMVGANALVTGPVRLLNNDFWRGGFEYLKSEVDYDGRYNDQKQTPAKGKGSDYVYTFEGSYGRRFVIAPSGAILEVSGGLAYRYLNNLIQLRGAYEREQTYFYSPVTMGIKKSVAAKWSVRGAIEYDVFWSGRNLSHFEDTNPRDKTLEFKQSSGGGTKLSVAGIRDYNINTQIVAELFYRSWDIDKSTTDKSKVDGRTYHEPANTTAMWGLSVGASF